MLFCQLLTVFSLLFALPAVAATPDSTHKPDLTMPAITLFQAQLSVRCLRNTETARDYQACIESSNTSMQDAIHQIASAIGLEASPDDHQARKLQACVIQAEVKADNAVKKNMEPSYWKTLADCIRGTVP